MLRGIQAAYLGPLLQGFQANMTAADTVTSTINGQGLSSIAATTSVTTATTKFLSRRNRLSVMTPVSSTFALPILSAAPTTNLVKGSLLDNTGSATTGKMNFVSLGFDHPSSLRVYPLQTVKSFNTAPRIITGHIKADGTITSGARNILSCSVASAVYTITLKKPFGRTPIILASCITSASHKQATVHTEGNATFKIATWGNGVASSSDFQFICFGWDTPVTNYGMRRSIRMTSIRPRLEFFSVTQSGGTYSMAVGNGTLTKNGTGDVRVNFPKAFARAPICIPIGVAGRANLKSNPGTANVTVKLYAANSYNTVADDDFQILCLGWDSTVEL